MVEDGLRTLREMGREGSLLIVRYYALGDIVLSFPLIHALRGQLPEARIDFLCLDRFREALEGVKELDEVLTMDNGLFGRARTVVALRKRKYDMALDLLSSPGSALITRLSCARFRVGMDTGRSNWCFHEVLPRKVTREGRTVVCYTADSNIETARLLGIAIPDPLRHREGSVREESYRTGFPAADRERDWADGYLESLGDKRNGFAGIVPGAKYRSKSWPEKNFIELARRLSEDLDLRPLVIWGPGEEEVADRLVEADSRIIKPPPTGIARLGALIGRLEVLVGIDSGPKHLAVIQGVPTVTVFGPTDPRVWDPMTPRHRAIFRNLDCRPCRDRDCADKRCMNSIDAGEVAEAVAEVLSVRDAAP